jgi:hypothetical protein
MAHIGSGRVQSAGAHAFITANSPDEIKFGPLLRKEIGRRGRAEQDTAVELQRTRTGIAHCTEQLRPDAMILLANAAMMRADGYRAEEVLRQPA